MVLPVRPKISQIIEDLHSSVDAVYPFLQEGISWLLLTRGAFAFYLVMFPSLSLHFYVHYRILNYNNYIAANLLHFQPSGILMKRRMSKLNSRPLSLTTHAIMKGMFTICSGCF